jgi:transcriptional regulator with XRE-family HTH domain
MAMQSSTGRSAVVLQNGAAIREIRKMKGWTMTRLAREVNASIGGMSHIEAERRSTTQAKLLRIAAVLDVPMAAIMRERIG